MSRFLTWPKVLLWAPAAAWAAVIWYLSSLPSPPIPEGVPDVVGHTLEYGLLGGLAWWGIAGGLLRRPAGWKALAVVGLCLLNGISDELHQAFVPGRDPSFIDLSADLTGATLAASVMWIFSTVIAAWRGGGAAGEPPEVVLLSRPDCHLCDEAEAVLQEVRREIPFRYEKVNVDSDDALRARYGLELPVVLVGGRKAFKYRVDPERLRLKLLRTAREARGE